MANSCIVDRAPFGKVIIFFIIATPSVDQSVPKTLGCPPMLGAAT